MNIRKLTSELARRERTKSQAKIQAIRSIVGHLSDMIYADWQEGNDPTTTQLALYNNGKRRAKRKKK